MSNFANEQWYEKRYEELVAEFLFQGYDDETADMKAYAVLSKEDLPEPV